ncbi:Sau3AI family type II restriction endonuclease [Aerococcus sp. NPDC058936]|uniref:Sau3AI family type II restriction endonuclease n=1 Tax=Aerococcus sp. NPDC058936 TaxID=3346674 RepID=UPI00366D8A43
MRIETIEELIEIAESAVGKTVKEYDINDRLASKGNKGGIGQILEEGLFGYAINSTSEADFGELGVELKATPVKQNKNKALAAKERLVLNIINYMKEVEYSFETSSFWRKNETILMMFYFWDKELDRGDYRILKSVLYTYPEDDLEIIKNDWEIIVGKIRAGKAEELSEGDTMYLGACTKGANKNSLRQQPFSDVPAMQRAFSLKASYMTTLVRKYIKQDNIVSFASKEELAKKSLETILQERFAPYVGLNMREISQKINYEINPKNKSTIANMISRILGITGTKLDNIEEFSKANIQFKTIRLEPNNLPKEHMSFENVDFDAWLNDSFEESQFYQKFEETKFLFVVFQYRETLKENPDRIPYFKKIVLWNMPEQTIRNEVGLMWRRGRKVLKDGVKLTVESRGTSNNLPSAKENHVTHIRPKAKDGKDKVQLPDGQEITKQAFWLNREYIAEIVKD